MIIGGVICGVQMLFRADNADALLLVIKKPRAEALSMFLAGFSSRMLSNYELCLIQVRSKLRRDVFLY